MTPEEKIIYQKGFMVAINFLFHHQLDAGGKVDPQAQAKFKNFLLAHTDSKDEGKIIEEAINLRTTMPGGENCGPGFCFDGVSCVRCKFAFAFDGTFHS
jgi:hypothetical protein